MTVKALPPALSSLTLGTERNSCLNSRFQVSPESDSTDEPPHVLFLLPEENLFHGGDRGSIAGDAQFLSVHLQLSEQQLKPEESLTKG